MGIALEVTMLSLLTFLLRLLFLCRDPFTMSSDALNSLYHVRRQKGSRWIRYAPIYSIQKGTLANSQLMMWITSRFNRRHWMKVAALQSIFADILTGMGVYALIAFSVPTGVSVTGLGMTPAGMAMLAFAVTPSLSPINARILGGVKARSAGGLIAFTYFLVTFAMITDGAWYGAWYWYAGAFVLVWLSILTSVFGSQAVVFFSVVISAIYMDPRPLAIVTTALVLGYFEPGVGVRDVLRWKAVHYKNYYRSIIDGGYLSKKNNPKEFIKVLKSFNRRPLSTLYYCSLHFIPTGALLSFPLLIILLGLVASENFSTSEVMFSEKLLSLQYFAVTVVFAAYVSAAAVSTKWTLFLGEAERYFEFAAPFGAIILTLQVAVGGASPAWYSAAIGVSLALVILNFIILNRTLVEGHFRGIPNPFPDTLIAKLKSLEGRVLCFPIKMSRSLSFIANTNKLEFYQRVIFDVSKRGFKSKDEDFGAETDVEAIVDRYQIDFVVLLDSAKRSAKMESLLFGYETLSKEGGYTVLATKNGDSGPLT